MLTGFPRTRWPRLRFSESYAVGISVKISRICEFRVIMGIMTGLLGCCSSSTLGSRANDYVKTLATLGFWLHHSPCSLGCWTNNTLAARSLSPKHTEWAKFGYLKWFTYDHVKLYFINHFKAVCKICYKSVSHKTIGIICIGSNFYITPPCNLIHLLISLRAASLTPDYDMVWCQWYKSEG